MIMNKKGQFESMLLAIVLIVSVGIIIFFMNHVNSKLYTSLDDYFDASGKYKGTEIANLTQEYVDKETSSTWDYVFLAIFLGVIIQIVIFSFATRINVAFFWLLIIFDIPIMVAGIILSNIWQDVVANPEFVTTIARFPITNALLGTYFPVVIVFMIFISSIILFGKRPGEV